jgi:hypothetical protein
MCENFPRDKKTRKQGISQAEFSIKNTENQKNSAREFFLGWLFFRKIRNISEIFPKSFGNISIDFFRSENFSLECLVASMALDDRFDQFYWNSIWVDIKAKCTSTTQLLRMSPSKRPYNVITAQK